MTLKSVVTTSEEASGCFIFKTLITSNGNKGKASKQGEFDKQSMR